MSSRSGGNEPSVAAQRLVAAARLPRLLRERARFLRSFLSSPRQVGAVLPTSRRTAALMLDLAPVASARCVVELGAGTGPVTAEILRRLGPQGQLLAFEIDPALAATLASALPDPRLRVITESATSLEAHLDGRRPEVIVSALPFTSLPAPVSAEILDVAHRVLADDGVMVILQYSPLLRRELQRRFASVEWRLSALNVPPAVLYACRPGPSGAPA